MSRQDEVDRGAVAAAALIVLAVFALLTLAVAVLAAIAYLVRRLIG